MEYEMTTQNNTHDVLPLEPVITAPVVPITMAIATQIRQKIEKLAISREVWEQTAYTRSNDMLYDLLRECYLLYKELTEKSDAVKNKRRGLDDYIALKGYSFKKETPLTKKIVRCVFGDADRRRLSTYHTVVRVAVADVWDQATFSSEITKRGGVQEISLGRRNDGLTPKMKAEAAKAHVLSQTLAKVSSDALSQVAIPDGIGAKAVAVMTQEADGSFTVHAVIHSDTVVNAALAAYYSSHSQEIKGVSDNTSVTSEKVTRDELVCIAAQAVANG
jgi:hypothetical protein